MSKEEIYQELKGVLLNSEKPSVEVKQMISEGKFNDAPFNIIVKLNKIKQNLEFHPEGNVFNHTMLVVDKASLLREQSEDKLVLMLSAFLHDIGKLTTTKLRKGKWTSYNHDKESSKMVHEFLDGLEDKVVIDKVSKMVLYHMQSLFFRNNISNKTKCEIVNSVEVDELILLTIADRTGRVDIDEEKELKSINDFELYLKKT